MKLHPIIQDYVNTEDHLDLILEKHLNKDQYLEIVLNDLVKSHMSGNFEQKLLLDLDLAVIKGHPDTNVYLLFIVVSIAITDYNNQYEKAKTLISIISSSLNEKIHPVIKTACIQAVAQVKFMEGKIKESNQLMHESMSIIDKKCPRYRGLLTNFAAMLAENGLLNELNKFDLKLLNSPITERQSYHVNSVNLTNCIATGNYKQGFDLIDKYKRFSPGSNSNSKESATNILKILSGDLNEDNFVAEPFKIFVRALSCLLSLKIEEAAKHLQLLKNNKRENFITYRVDEYLPLHIELCMGNKGMVRLLLKEKKEKGNSHYFDDLFYGRLQLLDKNEGGANESFSRLIEKVNRYGAMPRLIFELQFAKELNLQDLLFFTQGWKQEQRSTQFLIKKEVEIAPKSMDKGVHLLVGSSPEIAMVKDLVKKYASLKAPVLVTGETGTGKELVSRAIHDEGPNPLEPFLAINCGALTESLLQSELFGYVAGAFTGAQKERQGIFEAAGKGTVFLDEFGDISPQLQVALLRVLEANEIRMIGGTATRHIACRIVIATNVDLHKVVEEKKFREDLYFRLARFEIRLPAMRNRIADLPELIQYFLDKNSSSLSDVKKISNELLMALSQYRWPGNIRELKNEIERLYILNPDKQILDVKDFDFDHLQEPIVKKTDEKLYNSSMEVTAEIPINQEDSILKLMKEKGFQVEQRHELLREYFKKHKKLTRNQTIVVTKVSPSTATKDLQILCEEGFIIKKAPTKSPRTDYFEIVK